MLNTGLIPCKLLALSLSDVQEVEQVETLRFNDATATRTSKEKKTKQSKKTNKQTKKKPVGLISKTTTVHVHHSFVYNSLPFLHDNDVEMPNCAFCRERKQATTKFYFSF